MMNFNDPSDYATFYDPDLYRASHRQWIDDRDGDKEYDRAMQEEMEEEE